AIFAGGHTADQFGGSNAVDVFDASTGQWSTAALSQGRRQLAATSVGNVALFAGGLASATVGRRTSNVPSDAVDLYDASSGRWSTATLSQPRYLSTAATAGHFALFAGGITTDTRGQRSFNVASDRVDIYDARTGLWSTTRLSQAR